MNNKQIAKLPSWIYGTTNLYNSDEKKYATAASISETVEDYTVVSGLISNGYCLCKHMRLLAFTFLYIVKK